MHVQLIVALLRNEDGQWIEPDCMCYERQTVTFEVTGDYLRGNCTFSCFATPDEPHSKWLVSHVGIMAFIGTSKQVIKPIGKATVVVTHGKQLQLNLVVGKSVADVRWPDMTPALAYV